MLEKGSRYTYVTLLLVCCCLFLFGCSGQTTEKEETESPPDASEEVSYAALSIDYESFQKVVGWLSEDTLLVHIGDTENHELVSYHIFSGEIEQIYSSETAILTVEINERRDKILFQEIDNAGSMLRVISLDGLTIQTVELNYTSYVTLDWNATSDNTVFVSHYSYDHGLEMETIQVYIWTIDENTLFPMNIPSLSPKWYSANVYLYIDELETNALYIGDIREDGDNIMLNRDIAGFHLNQDTFLGFVESDISDTQLHIFHEYPFLIGDKAITVPKVTVNDHPVAPYLTQATRNGDIYGVIAEYAFALEEDLGEFHLSHLDFEQETVENILELPEDAPIALSPSEEHVLYGWRLEYITDLSDPELVPLIEILN